MPLTPMYPPRKEAEHVDQPPNEVLSSLVLGFVALCIAALMKFAGIGQFLLALGIGALLRAAMFRAGQRSKTRTLIVCVLGVAGLAIYYVTRPR